MAEAEAPRPALQRTRTKLEEDMIEPVFARMQRTRRLRKVAMVAASGVLVAAGVVMAAMMVGAAVWSKSSSRGRSGEWSPAPDWILAAPLLLGMAVTSTTLGILLQFNWIARWLLGTLEYTTIMIMDLKQGRTYKYRRQPKSQKEETPEGRLALEQHQLKVEAGLAGWSQRAVEEQISAIQSSYSMKYDECDEHKKTEMLKAESKKLVRMLMHTVYAMPLPVRIVNSILALVVVVFGALGAFLTVGIADMPDPNLDALWTEISWQVINAIFSIIAIWKGPQRVRLLWHLARRDYDVVIDGVVRNLMSPGVLLKRSEMMVVAVLRAVNVVAQYCCSYFMWAYLRRCYEETQRLHVDCKTKPAWGVPVFLVLGFASDQASNAILHHYIVSCPYIKWPAIETPQEIVPRSCYLEREEEEEWEASV